MLHKAAPHTTKIGMNTTCTGGVSSVRKVSSVYRTGKCMVYPVYGKCMLGADASHASHALHASQARRMMHDA